MRFALYREAILTATQLDGLVVENIDGVSATRYTHFYGANPKWVEHLRTWGEAGTIKIATDTTSKLMDKGVACMFVGYPLDHSAETYKMYDPKTNRIHVTSDIIWLNRMFFEKKSAVAEINGGGVLTLVTKQPKEAQIEPDETIHGDDGTDDTEVEIIPTEDDSSIVEQGGHNAQADDATLFENNPFHALMSESEE